MSDSPFLRLTPLGDLPERRVARLTRHELTAEDRRTTPACTCVRAELDRYGCHCPASHGDDEDELCTVHSCDGLRRARAALGVV